MNPGLLKNKLGAVARLSLALAVLVLLLNGCASSPGPDGTPAGLTSAESVIPLPEAQVRTAAVQVLREAGYSVSEDQVVQRVVTTGYKQEIESPWNWLLIRFFGVGRSRVDAIVRQDGDRSTRLQILVTYEAKDRLWGLWHLAEPPLPDHPTAYLQEIRQTLGLLPQPL